MNLIEKYLIQIPAIFKEKKYIWLEKYHREIAFCFKTSIYLFYLFIIGLFAKLFLVSAKNIYAHIFVRIVIKTLILYLLLNYYIFRYYLRPCYNYENIIYPMLFFSILVYSIHSNRLYIPELTSIISILIFIAVSSITIKYLPTIIIFLLMNLCVFIWVTPLYLIDPDLIFHSTNNLILIPSIISFFIYILSQIQYLNIKAKLIAAYISLNPFISLLKDITEQSENPSKEVLNILNELEKTKKYRFLILGLLLEIINNPEIKKQSELCDHIEEEHAINFKKIKQVKHLISDKFSRNIVDSKIIRKYFIDLYYDTRSYRIKTKKPLHKLSKFFFEHNIKTIDDIFLQKNRIFLEELFKTAKEYFKEGSNNQITD